MFQQVYIYVKNESRNSQPPQTSRALSLSIQNPDDSLVLRPPKRLELARVRVVPYRLTPQTANASAARAKDALKIISNMSMLIDERRQRQHSPTFRRAADAWRHRSEPLSRHTVNFIPPHPMRRAVAAIGRSWRFRRLSLPLPLPSLPLRFVGAFPYPLSHVDRHLSDSATLVRLSCRP